MHLTIAEDVLANAHNDEAFGLRRVWQVARFGFELGERLQRQRASQLTIDEIVAALVKAFSDLDEDGMRATARIQVNRDCTSGLVYFKRR
jgi:hypothetical protein